MDTINGGRRTTTLESGVSRRGALRSITGAAVTALALGLPRWTSAKIHHGNADPLLAPTSGDDPSMLIEKYVAAINAGDLEAILALYDDDAFHIALPSPDGSAGVCLGKEQFRMWYEQGLANGDRVEVEEDTLAVVGNQATFVARLSSEPWSKLGLEALQAHSEIVVIDGRIMTHVVLLTPESVRQLQAAGETSADLTIGSASSLLPSERRGPGEPY